MISDSPARYRSLLIAIAVLVFAGPFVGGPRGAKNKRVIDEHKVTCRTPTSRTSACRTCSAGRAVEHSTLPTAAIAPWCGAARRVRGALRTARDEAAATYPVQTLTEELILIGREGSATIEFDGKTAELAKDSVLYLQPGTKRSLKAGPGGWKAFEVYSPIRLDHLALAGQNTLVKRRSLSGRTPSIPRCV